MRQVGKVFGLISIGILIASCRPGPGKNNSQTKTLDSIASGKIDLDANQCEGPSDARKQIDTVVADKVVKFDKSVKEEVKNELRDSVKDYLSALPSQTVELFIKLGGEILVTDNVESFCKGEKLGQSKDQYGKSITKDEGEVTNGCFVFVQSPPAPDGSKRSPIFAIIHSAKREEIKYFGPQIFGYMYAQFYSRMDLTADKSGVEIKDQEVSPEFIRTKEKVANAFLRDILASESKKAYLENLAKLLGNSSSNELLGDGNVAEPLEKLSLLKNDPTKRKQVIDYVFANSFQSNHCNDHSRKIASDKFKKSSELFKEVDRAISDVSSKLLGVKAPQETSTPEGFHLAGGGMDFLSQMMMPMLGAMGGGPAGFLGLMNGGGMGMGGGYNPGQMGYGSPYQNQRYAQYNQMGMGGASPYAMFNQLASLGMSGSNCSNCQGNCVGGQCSMSGGCPGGNCGGYTRMG